MKNNYKNYLFLALGCSFIFVTSNVVLADQNNNYSGDSIPVLTLSGETMDVENNNDQYNNLPVLSPDGVTMEIDSNTIMTARDFIGPVVPITIYKSYTVIAFKSNYPYGPPTRKQWGVTECGYRYTGSLSLISKKTVPLGWECVYAGNLRR